MARGWESKAVEAQQAEAGQKPAVKSRLTREQAAQSREKQNLTMARACLRQQLASASAPRYRALLEKALEELEERLKQAR
jgi:hypothetical protein